MEKILGYRLDTIISGDTMETLQYRDRSKATDNIYIRNMYVAEDDGIVLLEKENVEYKKGDLLISFEYWRQNTSDTPLDNNINVVVNVNTTDLGQVLQNLKIGNEAV